MRKLLSLLAIATISVSSFAQDKKQAAIDDAILQKYFKEHKINAKKTASGMYYTIATPGAGMNAQAGQTVKVNYVGKTMDGHKFDANLDHGTEPFSFVLGQHQVIQGWDEGIALLNKGAKGTLYIPSQMAYGSRSMGDAIPANSVMMFDVELVDVQ